MFQTLIYLMQFKLYIQMRKECSALPNIATLIQYCTLWSFTWHHWVLSMDIEFTFSFPLQTDAYCIYSKVTSKELVMVTVA